MEHKNSVLDDISSAIGYTATTVICAWFGGKELYVPKEYSPEHPISRLIGESATKRLIRDFEGQYVFVPKNAIYYRSLRHRNVHELVRCNVPVDRICSVLNLSPTQVRNIRGELGELGLVPFDEISSTPPVSEASVDDEHQG